MFIMSNIKSINEQPFTYHPGGMAEISRGLREAIPPERDVPHPHIPEGLHEINAQQKHTVPSLRDDRDITESCG